MSSFCKTVSVVLLLLCFSSGLVLVAKERIFVDQWSPTQSNLYIADANGANARKLVPGSDRDYNGSFSFDGRWIQAEGINR